MKILTSGCATAAFYCIGKLEKNDFVVRSRVIANLLDKKKKKKKKEKEKEKEKKKKEKKKKKKKKDNRQTQ